MVIPPRARIDTKSDTHFGVTIQDPYRWMEEWHGEELQRWVEAQGSYARGYLDALPERAALLTEIARLGDTIPQLSGFQLVGGQTYYLRRDGGENVAKLVLRESAGARERILVDPAALQTEVPTLLDWFSASGDGRLVAYGLSQGGSEDSVLHVLETDTGRVLADTITRTRFNQGRLQWLRDGGSFLYHRMTEMPEGAPETDRYRDSRIYLHRVGDDPAGDVPVFGAGLSPQADLERDDIPFVRLSTRSDWMIGVVARGVRPEVELYAAPLSSLPDAPDIPWVKVVGVEDEVSATPIVGQAFDLAGETLYLRTSKEAARYQVVALDVREPDRAHIRVLVPPSEAVVDDLRVAGGYLVTRDIAGGIARLRRVALEGGEPEPIPLPVAGSIASELDPGWAVAEETGEVVIRLTSWIEAPRVYRCTMAAPELQNTGWIPPAPIDLAGIEAHELEYPSHDGVMVPISVIHRRGLRRDGSNPAMVRAYGSYGISQRPRFLPEYLAWYQRGGVLAVAHVRGGGEHGKEWYDAGRGLNKSNTIDDFIAAAEFLIQEGYTRPDRLAGQGRSAGGIPTGGALVKRPDLYAVMVMHVAVTNCLRFEFSENGPPNVPEFGSISTEDGFHALQIIDSYTKVQNGTGYPACLITTGLNDPRVVVWQATKMAARLQEASSSGRPILLRVDVEGGHGIGSTRRQEDEELADTLAFLLRQFARTPVLESAEAGARV